MDPDHGRMSLRPALLQRLEQVGRDVHVADAAAVADLLEIHDALAGLRITGVCLGLVLDVALIIRRRVIFRILADVELLGALGIHHHLGPRPLPASRRRCLLLLTGRRCLLRLAREVGHRKDRYAQNRWNEASFPKGPDCVHCSLHPSVRLGVVRNILWELQAGAGRREPV